MVSVSGSFLGTLSVVDLSSYGESCYLLSLPETATYLIHDYIDAMLCFHWTSDHYHFILSYLPISQSISPYHTQIISDCFFPFSLSLIPYHPNR